MLIDIWRFRMSKWIRSRPLLILCALLLQSIEGKVCPFTSFYIENNDVVEGKVLDHYTDVNLNECASKCAEHNLCDSAHFGLSITENPICMLIDSTKNGSLNELPNSSIYSLRRYCLNKKTSCHSRHWTYERFRNYELVDDEFLLGSTSDLSLEYCLNSCSRINECEGALYNDKTQECRLSRINLNNINGIRRYFKYSEAFDLYESNCQKRHIDMSHCSFTRINQAGFVDIFDERLSNVKSLTECEVECLDWSHGICRSYTYNSKEKQCFLSHSSQKALGRSVLESLGPYLTSGEIDDCMDFKLDCRGKGLGLKGTSIKLFKGQIQTKKDKKTICQQNVVESYHFEVDFSYEKCRIDRNENAVIPTFSGLIFVKEGSTNLITVHDKVVEVKCQISDQPIPQRDTELSFHFEVEDQNSSISLNGIKDQTKTPKYKLDVFNEDGELTTVADMHKKGYLIVDADGNESQSFIVTSLIAEDSFNTIQLIDSNGCVENTKLITSMERISPNKFKIGILFDGFPDQASVTYQTLIKPCNFNCELECNKQFYNTKPTVEFKADLKSRKIRSTNQTPNKRRYFLSEQIYRVRRTIMASDLSKEEKADLAALNDALDSNYQPTTNKPANSSQLNIWQCFTEYDFGCMFTIGFALLQVMLFLSCSCLVYKYAKKWVRYYKRRDQIRRPSTFEDIYDYVDTSYGETQTSTVQVSNIRSVM